MTRPIIRRCAKCAWPTNGTTWIEGEGTHAHVDCGTAQRSIMAARFQALDEWACDACEWANEAVGKYLETIYMLARHGTQPDCGEDEHIAEYMEGRGAA